MAQRTASTTLRNSIRLPFAGALADAAVVDTDQIAAQCAQSIVDFPNIKRFPGERRTIRAPIYRIRQTPCP